MTWAVEMSGVTRRFGSVVALGDVTCSIGTNSITALLGRNGAGKTTLMSCITAQDFPTSGDVRLFDEPPMENDRVLRQSCFVRENQRYLATTVGHVLNAAQGFHPAWDSRLADHLVAAFDLPPKRQVQKLSRGMTSALGAIVGLASRAPLTIFDEPHLGLDAAARQLFYDELLADHISHPRTVLLSTHLVDEVSAMLDHVLVLDAGRLVVDSPADDLRGCATTVVGQARRVATVSAGLEVLDERRMGSAVSRTVYGRFDDVRREAASAASVQLYPLSLQQLVVHAAAIDALAERPGLVAAGGVR